MLRPLPESLLHSAVLLKLVQDLGLRYVLLVMGKDLPHAIVDYELGCSNQIRNSDGLDTYPIDPIHCSKESFLHPKTQTQKEAPLLEM